MGNSALTLTPADPSQPLKIFISTGEVSGDLQGALLIQALHRQAQALGITLEITALGGDRMAAAGATLLGNTTAVGSVGIFEALPYLIPALRFQGQARQYLRLNPPDLVVYIDYMGPNLSLGKFVRRSLPQVTTAYYISPHQWVLAVNSRDTEALVAIADQMLAIFPQEATYYRDFGAQVTWVGHPLVDRFSPPPDPLQARQQLGLGPEDKVVVLVPASRGQEMVRVLPPILAAAKLVQAAEPQVKFLVPLSRPTLKADLTAAIADSGLTATLVDQDTQAAIAAADVALTKSGTVNLEIALMNVPQVVTYCLNPITARIAYYLLRLKASFVSPVNLVLEEGIVPEFIQWQATPTALADAVLTLLKDPAARAQMHADYGRLRQVLGEPGACDRAAQLLLAQARSPEAIS